MDEQANLTELRRLFLQYFNLSELRSLAHDLDVNFEVLAGDNLSAKVEEFLGYMHRRGRIGELIAAAEDERPHVSWPRIETDLAEVPFVIVAMTHEEAVALLSADAPDQRVPDLGPLTHTVPDASILPQRYHVERDGWEPYGSDQGTIREIIDGTIAHLNNDEFVSQQMPRLRPAYHSAAFFAPDDEQTRRNTWWELHQTGCVFIVDPISLLHPFVEEQLLQSQLSAKSEVAMFVLSPVDPDTIPANAILETEVNRRIAIPFMRFDQKLDHLCEFGIGNERALRRRLYAALPETASLLRYQRANPTSRSAFRRQMGAPRRIDRAIFR